MADSLTALINAYNANTQRTAANVLTDAAKQQIIANNPYNDLVGVTGLTAQAANQAFGANPSMESVKELAVVNAVSGLLSGIFKGLGGDYSNTLADRYTQSRGDLAAGGTGEVADLPSSLFQTAKDDNALFQAANAMAQKAMVDDAIKAGLTARLTKQGELGAYGEMSGGGDSTAPNFMNPADEKKESQIDSLRKEVRGQKAFTDFQLLGNYSEAMSKALEDTNAMSDLELVRYSILSIEPGMAVREGEQEAVSNSPSIPDQYRGIMQNVLEGKFKLTASAREGLAKLMKRSYEAKKTAYDNLLTDYKTIAAEKGLDNRMQSIFPSFKPNPAIDRLLSGTLDIAGSKMNIDAIADKIKTKGVESLTPEEIIFAQAEKKRLQNEPQGSW